MHITDDELLKCKRAVVVFTEFGKVIDDLMKSSKTLEARKDIQVLVNVLRRLEAVAVKSAA